MDNRFLRVEEVARCMDISIPTAYKVIRRLNDELREKGYLTISGRVSRAYFEKKLYSGECA